MSKEIRNQIYKNFAEKETKELLDIWIKNDRVEWSDLAFEVLKEVLKKRVKKLPSQNKPVLQYQESENEGLEDWEIKLLDNKNQPELYDVLEVLNLKDNINKVAKAAVVITIFVNLLSLYPFQRLLRGEILTITDLENMVYPFFRTIATTAIEVAIVYFSLKALSHILRILMEMEFTSRNAK